MRRLLILLTVLGIAFTGAACGGDDDKDDGGAIESTDSGDDDTSSSDDPLATDLEAFCYSDDALSGGITAESVTEFRTTMISAAPDELQEPVTTIADALSTAAAADDPEAAMTDAFADPDVKAASDEIAAFCVDNGFEPKSGG